MEKWLQLKNVPVEEFTTPCPITVDRKATITSVTEIMRKEGIRHIPVVDGDEAVGLISDGDLKLALAFVGADRFVAEDIMSKDLYTVAPDTSLDSVALDMAKRKYGSAIVNDWEGKIYGIFTTTDALNALVEVLRGEV